jgi:hypothetical protein
MKTIFKNGTYERVSDEVAEQKIKQGFKFVSKQEWKKNWRDIQKVETPPEVVIANETKSEKKLQRRKKLKEKQY